MSPEEILKQTSWDGYGIGTCSLFVPLFGKVLPLTLFAENAEKPELTEKMVQAIQDILTLGPEAIQPIKDLLWEECLFAFQVADYGVEPMEGETSLKAHLREFELANREDTYWKSSVKEIQISHENDAFMGRYAEIKIETATNNSISIIVKNGKVIDFDDDGTFLGWFEKDEQYAQKKRAQTLGTGSKHNSS